MSTKESQIFSTHLPQLSAKLDALDCLPISTTACVLDAPFASLLLSPESERAVIEVVEEHFSVSVPNRFWDSVSGGRVSIRDLINVAIRQHLELLEAEAQL